MARRWIPGPAVWTGESPTRNVTRLHARAIVRPVSVTAAGSPFVVVLQLQRRSALVSDQPFRRYAQDRTTTAVDAVVTGLSGAIRERVAALQAEIDAGLTALVRHVGTAEHGGVVDGLVEDLASTATRDLDDAVARARHESERAAHGRITQIEAATHQQLEQARAEHDALRQTIQTLTAERDSLLTARETEARFLRSELTAVREQAAVEHTTMAAALTAAQQDAANERRDLLERETRLADLERSVEALEATRRQLDADVMAQQILVADAAQQRTALAQALEAAQEAQRAAQAEAETYQTEWCDATEQLGVLQRQHAIDASQAVLLPRVRDALQAFTRCTSPRETLDTFLQQLGCEFERVAFFVVRGDRLEVQGSAGFEPMADVRKIIVPLALDSPLTRAVAQAASTLVDSRSEHPVTGLAGHETACAVAIPLRLNECVVAVAYGETARTLPRDRYQTHLHVAEILTDQFLHAFTASLSSPDAPTLDETTDEEQGESPTRDLATSSIPQAAYDGPPRAVARIRVPPETEVMLDGDTVRLVDIASRGAQVLSEKAIRPNQAVRIGVPRQGGPVLCQGRVVWARLEIMPRGTCYRAGVQFTTVDTRALEAVMEQQFGPYRTSA
jgi:hypothetical protein